MRVAQWFRSLFRWSPPPTAANHHNCPWFDPATHACLADDGERAIVAEALALGGWPDVPSLKDTEVLP